MKASRIVPGLILGIFAICLCAQTPGNECPNRKEKQILWVVDGVALKDSVFDYTLDQMRSDTAAVLASRVLSWVYPNDITEISVQDSTEALEYCFPNCNGVISITTTFREPLLVIINGILNKSKGKVSAGEILGGYTYIQHIIKDEFADIMDYGVKECVLLKEVKIGCHWLRTPFVVVITETPYYRNDNLVGRYTGKRGKHVYELMLNADSTYKLSKRNIHKKAITPEISSYGTWNISKGEITLVSSQDPANLLQGNTVSLGTVRLKIKTERILTLPKGFWNNTKSVTLRRQENGESTIAQSDDNNYICEYKDKTR